jgi:quercetin dioxygenase-like cupin family protein
MRTRITLALTIAMVSVLIAVGIVQATPASGVTTTTIATGSLDPVNLLVKNGDWMAQIRTKGQSSLQVVENDVAPGGSFGWHSHPGPSLVIVKSGTITFYMGDDPTCTPEVRTAGDAFIDSGQDVHIGRNEGTVPAVVIVTRLLPAGAPARIDQPDPGNCGF